MNNSNKSNAINYSNDDFQQQMDNLLQLVMSSNDDNAIEDAVSSILGASKNDNNDSITYSSSKTNNELKVKKRKIINNDDNITCQDFQNKKLMCDESTCIIQEDEDDYDDDGVNNNQTTEEEHAKKITKAKVKNNNNEEPKWTGPKVTISSIEQQEKEHNQQKLALAKCNNNPSTKMIELNQTLEKVNHIPLGKIGARMMITFGDNIHTNPDALVTALHGTRKCLQNAIQDARALKRKMKNDYERAKVMVNLHSAKRKQRSVLKHNDNECNAPVSGNVDPNMLFEAIGGYSKVGYESKCGFDDIQLEKLFPEEMNAYRRWRQMHNAYTKKQDDTNNGVDDENGNDDDNSVDDDIGTDKEKSSSDNNDVKIENQEWGGHLKDRLAQFDARTERMKEEWYMTFSVVRQGSFLSKSFSAEDREWEKSRKRGKRNTDGRGKRKSNNWESFPASYVQFLHWIGFDHRSALPPPNEETTEALAFLGYDFMGKIVEKAIFLRCLDKVEQQRFSHKECTKIILELEPGEQLTKEDIERALNDSTVGIKPLYYANNSVGDKGSTAQLYFGPGFEERLEMELEEMVMGQMKHSKISEEEMRIRQEEDMLFKEIRAPPTKVEGVSDVLGEDKLQS